jgi:hypothetical protein
MDLDKLNKFLKKIQDKFHPDKIRQVKRLRDIRNPWIRRILITFIVVFSIAVGYTISLRTEETAQRQIRDEFVTDLKKKGDTSKVANWTLVKNFNYKGHIAGIYTYQTKAGMNVVLYDVDNKKVILTDVVNTKGSNSVKKDNTILAAQLILYLIDSGKVKKVDSVEKLSDVGFKVNGKEYKVDEQYSRLTSVNGETLKKYYNVHLAQPAQRRILRDYGVKGYDNLLIGRVETGNDGSVTITARERDSHDVYLVISKMDNSVKVIKVPGVKVTPQLAQK